jgi:microcystin-dependent protein
MPWPGSSISTANLDAGTDSPALARPALLAAVQAVNDIVSMRAVADGVASLDSTGQVPAAQIPQVVPAGVGMPYFGSTAPTGWVLASGRTIGSASSGATERANADTLALFTLLWTSMADAQAPVSGGRGASAAADFAANKTIQLPDLRGRTVAGRDDMGGTAASRLTNSGTGNPGVAGATLGASGGVDRHTLTTPQMPSHTHAQTGNTGQATSAGSFSIAGTLNTLAINNTQSTGGGEAHPNVQPTLVANYIIKL